MLTQEAPAGKTACCCRAGKFNALTAEQVEFYHEQGYLHLPAMFTQAEIGEMSADMDWMIQQWAFKDQGWTGPWASSTWMPARKRKAN